MVNNTNISEKEFLETYDITKFPQVSLTADVILAADSVGVRTGQEENPEPKVLLIKRKNHPYKDKWALPGGFVDPDETPEEAAERELREETSLEFLDTKIQQLGAFASPDRDPRGYVCSIVHYVNVSFSENPVPQDDAMETKFFPVSEILKMDLAFDHNEIISYWISKLDEY